MNADLCGCGRQAVDVVRVVSDDDVLLVPMCADCIEIGDGGAEQSELFTPAPPRRPLMAMPARDEDRRQQELPLDDVGDEERGAA
ncbi:MAG TPA: hypothetical protein VFQ62_16405 [Methylomirabilota bacterium]|nr:hypothetical protein [Methylomirabilota bacterium]